MQKSKVVVQKIEDGRITIVKINRLEVRNCVDTETALLLIKAFRQFEESSSQIAIFHGGETFCAGFDLGEAARGSAQTFEGWKTVQNGRGPMGPSRMTLSKPVIGAVTGYAVAGGLQLACWCDMLVSHEEATFGVFCRRFGVPLIDGGTVRLAKIIGLNRARDMILTGRAVNGKEAFSWGLVSRLVQKNQVLAEAIELAKSIIVHPKEAMLGDRQSLIEATFPMIDRDLHNQFRIGTESLQRSTQKGAKRFKEEKIGRGGIFPKL